MLEQVVEMTFKYQISLTPREEIIKHSLTLWSTNCRYCAPSLTAAARLIIACHIAECTVHCITYVTQSTLNCCINRRVKHRFSESAVQFDVEDFPCGNLRKEEIV
jgi:hypothetical protein